MDALTRFLIETGAARGEHVALSASWRELLARHPYPSPVLELVGETLAAAALFSPTIKASGRVTLQVQGGGHVRLLVAQCNGEGALRGMATYDVSAIRGSQFRELVGEGQMAVTLERDSGRQYQGIVGLQGDSLSQALEEYFGQSEQVPCQLHLAANGELAAGFLLQRLPQDQYQSQNQTRNAEQDWERIVTLAATLSAQELLSHSCHEILHRLFHEEQVRVFEPRPLKFECGCSEPRIRTVLSSMSQEELESIIAEEGELVVTCEFCSARYRIDPASMDSGETITRH